MEPSELSARLRQIASYVDTSRRPSLRFVRSTLAAAVLATDRSLSEAVGKALAAKVAQLMPEEFNGETYDTADKGKGFKDGYVSFAMDPNTWESAGIIGGILFMCRYNPADFKSEAPEGEGADAWQGHSKGEAVVTLTMTAGYYNKTLGGGVDGSTPLGTCTVMLDAKEQVVEADIDDTTQFEKGVTELIRRINESPPDEAVSASRRRKSMPPTTSEKTLIQWLTKQNRTDVKRTEINDLVRSMSKRTGEPAGQVLERVNGFFKKRGWPVDEKG